jgi:hypothetical protein
MSEEREVVTYDEAVAMLPDGDSIHTFIESMSGVLLGADWERDEILKVLKAGEPERTGPAASGMNHGLAVITPGRRLFIETKPSPTKETA